jgi:rubrerythrin
MLSKIPLDTTKVSKDHKDMEILRAAIIAELDAINLYEQMAAMTDDARIKAVLMDVAEEEKTHAGEFQAVLLLIDKQMAAELLAGKEEVEEMLKG